MTASTPYRTVALLAAALAVSACQRQEPATIQVPAATDDAANAATEPTTEPAAEPAPDTAPGTDAISVEPNTASEAGVQPQDETIAGLEKKAFAGSFSAQGAKLELAADGTYAMTVHAESAGADLESGGTWTVEADGTRILLDPDSKSEQDSVYAVASADELRAVDGSRVLTRDGTR